MHMELGRKEKGTDYIQPELRNNYKYAKRNTYDDTTSRNRTTSDRTCCQQEKIMQAQRVHKKPEENLIKKITMNENSTWTQHSQEIMEKYRVGTEDLAMSKQCLTYKVNKKDKEQFKELIEQEVTTMSKIKHWKDLMERNLAHRPEYIDKLGRKQCSANIKARRQMIPTETNMRGNQQNLKCTLCKSVDQDETPPNILEECNTIRKKT